jgi:hypothetical protein
VGAFFIGGVVGQGNGNQLGHTPVASKTRAIRATPRVRSCGFPQWFGGRSRITDVGILPFGLLRARPSLVGVLMSRTATADVLKDHFNR